MFWNYNEGRLALLGPDQKGSLAVCRNATGSTISQIPVSDTSEGSQICVTTPGGDIGLITILGFSGKESVYVAVDVTVWRQSE